VSAVLAHDHDEQPDEPIGPYRHAGWRYHQEGWSPIPVKPGTKGGKGCIPSGVTGDDGRYLSGADVAAFVETHGDHNIAVRAPLGVIGIDIDQYGSKKGWDNLEALRAEHDLEPLPPTWRSSSRPEPSGIRWYRLPAEVVVPDANGEGHPIGREELRLAGAPVAGVEIIQRHHRYAVCWPTIHPGTKRPYLWHMPDGDDVDEIPRPDDLAELPAGWAVALGAHVKDERPASNAPASAHLEPEPEWSPAVVRARDAALDAMLAATEGGRHDAGLKGAMSLLRLEERGDPGSTAALEQLGRAFIGSVTQPGEGQRTEAQAIREWLDIVEGGRRKAETTAADAPRYEERHPGGLRLVVGGRDERGEHEDQAVVDPEEELERQKALAPVLPETFWSARPALQHIRTAAHARTRSADLVLHATLARLIAYTPHTYELPPIVGSAGSLNYFTAAIGPSGAGKSSGCTIAGELISRPPYLDVADDQTLGSGEGLAELFMGTVEEEGDGGKKVKVRRQVRYNAFVYGDEGQALTAMMERRGATLPEAIRRAWTGGALGQANASAERTRVIHAGAYRIGLVIGFQPELAGQLLADATAGTPQRFLWAWATDPTIPDEPPEWPGPLEVPEVPGSVIEEHTVDVRGHRRRRMTVSTAITAEIRQDALERSRGVRQGDELDSHQPLHLLKVAAALAILDGRLSIDDEDWALAKTVWHTSCHVRSVVVASVQARSIVEEQARVDAYARREHAAEVARMSAPGAVQRVARLIGRKVHAMNDEEQQPADGWATRDLRRHVAGRDKHLVDAAIDHAFAQGWLNEPSAGRYGAGESRPA
jgi:hypothetical protein